MSIMIKATDANMKDRPYLTKVTDQNGKSAVLDSRRIPQETYLYPGQLLSASLAGCLRMTALGLFFARNVDFRDISVVVDMQQNDEGKVIFTFDIQVDSDAAPEIVEQLKKETVANSIVRGLLTSEIIVRQQ